MVENSAPMTVGFCGTGEYSVLCAQALHRDPHFQVSWVITPAPKPVGRKKVVTPSPLDSWAQQQGLPVIHVETNLKDLESAILALPAIDYLLVVSFGYLIPSWLLTLPKIGAVNVHPSDLPKYRGSSPGQFVLLYGEKTSAVSVMLMNTKFDQGAIIKQLPLTLSPLENQESYYHKAFALAQENLPHILQEYALNHQSTPQPTPSVIDPLARRLSREDGFLPYSVVLAAQQGEPQLDTKILSQFGPALQDLVAAQPELTPAQYLDRAMRAFHPWPGIWTIVPEYKGKQDVREKLLDGSLETNGRYILHTIQFEGEAPQEI
jgi:methionyl-tRNA formyltransferase